jgi:N6-adenosine-specific RNA methylase IME4
MKHEKKYNVIYADPPWKYENKRTGGSMISGADDKYLTTSATDLKDLAVQEITAENALCFMWATVPLMDEGIDLLKAWGFTYKRFITWEKTGILGMGHWLRVQTEHILIGVKEPFKHQEKNIYKHPVCEHSAKPHFFRELVMKLADKSFDECTRLELFARTRSGMFGNYEYDGWDVFGNQVEGSILLPTKEAEGSVGKTKNYDPAA